MKPESEVVKRTCAEPERRRVSVASRWFCETLCRQIGRIIWHLFGAKLAFSGYFVIYC